MEMQGTLRKEQISILTLSVTTTTPVTALKQAGLLNPWTLMEVLTPKKKRPQEMIADIRMMIQIEVVIRSAALVVVV